MPHEIKTNISDKNKFLTTFNEKASAKNTLAIRLPHELKKFQNLRILDIAAGLNHILLFAVSKFSPTNSLDITSSDANENIPIHTLPKSDASIESVENKKRPIELLRQNTPDFKNIISSKPILTKETLEGIQIDTQIGLNESINQTIISPTETQPNTFDTNIKVKSSKPIETVEDQTKLLYSKDEVIKQTSDSSGQVETMDMLTKGVSNIGDSLMNDIKSIATTGEEKLNDLAKETEKAIKEVPKNVIDYAKTSMGIEKEEEKENNTNMDDSNMHEMMKKSTEEIAQLDIPNEKSDTPPIRNANLIEPDNDENIKQNNKLNRSLAQDVTVFDELKDDSIDNEVKFINNGVDVSSTSNIIQAMNDEINEMSSDAKNKSDELTMKYDGMINDKLSGAKEAISNKMFQIKNGEILLRIVFLNLFSLKYTLKLDGSL